MMKSRHFMLFIGISFSGPSQPAAVRDPNIYGALQSIKQPLDPANSVTINTACYDGMAYVTCVPKPINDDTALQETLPYYLQLPQQYGKPYCLQCCSQYQNNIDLWNLTCKMSLFTALGANVYGYEFRFAEKKTLKDQSIVTCPLARSACTYKNNKMVSCNRANDRTFLHGYILTVDVKVYDDKNFNYWTGVLSCSAKVIEMSYPLQAGDYFQEIIYVNHIPKSEPPNLSQLGLLGLIFYFFAYAILYYCRKKYCVVCQKRLVFSPSRCYICQFVGAYPPDPYLMQALEEKTKQIQGTPPELVPGSSDAWDFLKKVYRWLKRWWCPDAPIGPSGGDDAEVKAAEDTKEEEPDSLSVSEESKQKMRENAAARRKLKALRDKNPNRLPYSEHVIYSAVGHNNPPPLPGIFSR